MKTIYAIFFILLFFRTTCLFAIPLDMILAGDPILDDIRFLSLETGSPFLSFTPPLAPGEIENFINNIEESSLSQPALESYRRIQKRLVPSSKLALSFENFNAFFNLKTTVEGRIKFNSDFDWYSQEPEIAPFLSLPIRMHFYDYIQLYIDPILAVKTGSEWPEMYEINIPFFSFDERTPLRSFMAIGNSWWNFQIGRDQLRWGTAHTGSLTFNDPCAYYDFARFSFFVPNIKYSVIINQFKLTTNEDFIDDIFWNNDEALKQTAQRYFYLHRIDFTLFDKVSVGLMEGLMVGNSALELRYLNPLLLFHSLLSWNDYSKWFEYSTSLDMTGSFFSLELNWNIFNSLSFYGQFVMNEFATPAERTSGKQTRPNALGYIAGLQYSYPFNLWGSVFFLEFIYTDPYLYILSSPFASFIKMHHSSGQIRFIGYPRDTFAVTLGTEFFNKDTLSFSGSFSWISKGEHDKNGITWDWERTAEAANQKTPTGTAENNLIVSFGSQWKIFPFLVLKGNINGIFSFNNNHNSGINAVGGQASLSVSYSY